MRITNLLCEIDDRALEELMGSLAATLGRKVEWVAGGHWRERLGQLLVGDIDAAYVCGGVVADQPGLVPLAAPVYAGETQPIYGSEVVVAERGTLAAEAREDLGALRGRVFAFNEPESHSGVVHFKDWLASQGHEGFVARAVETGSHRASMRALRQGRADYATIDSHVWARHTGTAASAGLISVARIGRSPSPPLAIWHGSGEDSQVWMTALVGAAGSTPSRAALAAAGIERFEVVSRDVYQPLAARRRQLLSTPLVVR